MTEAEPLPLALEPLALPEAADAALAAEDAADDAADDNALETDAEMPETAEEP